MSTQSPRPQPPADPEDPRGNDEVRRGRFTLSRNLKIGDLLTTVTVVASVAALVVSWQRDYKTRVQEDAQQARMAAAGVLRKLERYQALQLSIHDDVQPLLVEVSKITDEQGHPNVSEQIDRLYAGVKALRAKQLQRILDEDVVTAYTELLAYRSGIRENYRDTISDMNEWSGDELEKCALQLGQDALIDRGQSLDLYRPADAGNDLRGVFGASKEELEGELKRRLDPLINALSCYIEDDGSSVRSFLANVDRCDEVLRAERVESPSPLSCDELR